MDSVQLLALCAIIVGTTFYFLKRLRRTNYPPGPPGYPIIGNMLQISPDLILSDQFATFAKKYGPIFALQIAKYRIVILSDANLIRETFNDPIMNGRPNNKVFRSLAHGNYGILSIDGHNWMEQRKFTLRHLKEFGFGKNQMENLILEEVKVLLDKFKEDEGNSVELSRSFRLAIVNSLWVIMTGSRIEHDDPYLHIVLENLFKIMNEVFCQSVLSFVPELATLLPERSGWNSLIRAIDAATKYLEEIVADHQTTFTEGEPRDFIDSYLSEIYKTKEKGSNFFQENGHKNLVSIMLDLFAAGAETTSTTLLWSALYLAKCPQVQKKLQEEIDSVIGQSRLPSLTDKPKMPYTEAVMMEVLRHSSIADLGLFHVATENTKLGGYDIPKNTLVLGNFWWVHRDPKNWKDPEEFNPERFLNEEKTQILKSENLMPFSVGRRVCLGEALARDEFFLFLTSIFQRFDIQLDPKRPVPSYAPQNTFILKPQEYHVILRDRLVS